MTKVPAYTPHSMEYSNINNKTYRGIYGKHAAVAHHKQQKPPRPHPNKRHTYTKHKRPLKSQPRPRSIHSKRSDTDRIYSGRAHQQIYTISQQVRRLMQQLPPTSPEHLPEHHQHAQALVPPPQGRQIVRRPQAARPLQEATHVGDHLRRRFEHGDGPADGPVEGVAVGPDDERREIEHPRSVEERVVAGVVFEVAAQGGGDDRPCGPLVVVCRGFVDDQDLGEEAQGVEGGVAGARGWGPGEFHAPLRAVVILRRDAAAEETVGAR